MTTAAAHGVLVARLIVWAIVAALILLALALLWITRRGPLDTDDPANCPGCGSTNPDRIHYIHCPTIGGRS